MIENTIQRSFPHKCGQESCCNAFNAVVAAFSKDISAFLSLPCTFVIYLHLWNFLEGGLRGRRGPPHRHMPDPRRVFLSDQYPWTLTCSTVSYEVSLWFPLLGRIVNKMWYLSPLQGPKFLLPHTNHKILQINKEFKSSFPMGVGNSTHFINIKIGRASCRERVCT